ncbi:MAG: hypothetical protein A2X49_01975 [Lentisphaerae bacterium GWF2_52_8]|nr:MAG: hypothetical protein A2X49_01975 [Lentisphaerae bacterium GWF2_52_8]
MIFFVRAFVLAATLQTFSSFGVEMLKNGDFESDMASWSITDWKQEKGSASIDSAVFASGKKSLKLVNDSPEQTTMLQQYKVDLIPQQKYTLKFKIKTLALVPNDNEKGAGAAIMILNAGKHVIEGSPAGKWKQTSGTNDWQDCTIEFTPENINGSSTLYLVLRKSTGTVYFDDISIVKNE